jgi:hypothetical protein
MGQDLLRSNESSATGWHLRLPRKSRSFPVDASSAVCRENGVIGKFKHLEVAPTIIINWGLFRAVSQLLWPGKGREVWFSLGEHHEKACRSPDFLQRGTS